MTNTTAYGGLTAVTTTGYDAHGRAVSRTDALGNGTVGYYSGDRTPYRAGGAVYPTGTARDSRGRQSELRTWRDEAGEPDVTRWRYDDVTGLLTNKVYADGKGPVYTYTADGRVSSRTWARSVSTTYTYAYTANGDVHAVGYSDATPGVTNHYDLAGRLVSVIDGTGSRALSYDAKGRQTAATNSLAALTRHYDAQGRDIGYDLDLPGFATNTFSVRYGYDGHDRLDRVTSALDGATNDFAYAFLPGTAMVSGMAGTPGLGWTRTYAPGRNLITAVSNFWGSSQVSACTYGNDALGRRTLRLDCGTSVPPVVSTNVFCYNFRSEVTNAAMGSANYSYDFDDIGNRKWAAADASLSTYAANELNEYTSVTNAGAAVSVAYDMDGNMLTNGVWAYTWDAENRMTSAISNNLLIVSNAYDYLNRRVRKTVGAVTRHYVWDRWNIAAEIIIDSLAGSTNTHYYTWGLDLSGTLQGAGGVGGLLAEVRDNGVFFPCYDANGNIAEYVDATGTVRGHFVYSAFGEITAQSGDLADDFTHRFSTKPFDSETGVSKYQLRDYLSDLGRWLIRDPIDVNGGKNLVVACGNNLMDYYDYLGLVLVFTQEPTDFNETRESILNRRPAVTKEGAISLRYTRYPVDKKKTYLGDLRTIGSVRIYIRKGYDSNAPITRRWGGKRSTLEHEQVHVLLYRTNLSELDSKATQMMHLTACNDCTDARIKYLSSLRSYYVALNDCRQIEFDVHDYTNNAERNKIIEQQATALRTLQEQVEAVNRAAANVNTICSRKK